jgi:hypothetical protein
MMIFLSSPYTSADPLESEARYLQTREFTAKKLREGFALFSPITYCVPLSHEYQFPTDYEYWLRFNMKMLKAARELWVLQLPGWDMSKGVTVEIEIAMHLFLNITYFDSKFEESGRWPE